MLGPVLGMMFGPVLGLLLRARLGRTLRGPLVGMLGGRMAGTLFLRTGLSLRTGGAPVALGAGPLLFRGGVAGS